MAITQDSDWCDFTIYYHKFIKGYAKIACPLHELISGENAKWKHRPVEWDDQYQALFEALKKLCSECPVLACVDYSKPFVLHTDASTTGLGAVLYQNQSDGEEKVIYVSQTLNWAEHNYVTHKADFLALNPSCAGPQYGT